MNNISAVLEQLRHRVRRNQFSKALKQSVSRAGSAANFCLDPVSLFMDGYTAASETEASVLARHLNIDDELKKRIIVEGALVSVAALDIVKPMSENRIDHVLAHFPVPPVVIYQALGGAFGATGLKPHAAGEFSKSFFGWMFFDCYGFHKGYYDWTETLDKGLIPEHISGIGRYAFDCGVGRAIWIVAGANPHVAAEFIKRFAPERRPALWSGIGLYTAILGAGDHKDVKRLRNLAGKFSPNLQEGLTQGVFILNDAKASLGHINGVCEVLCSTHPDELLRIAISHLDPNPLTVLDATRFLQWKDGMALFFSN